MKVRLDWHFWVWGGVTFCLIISTTDLPRNPYASWRLYAVAAVALAVGLLAAGLASEEEVE